MLIISYIYLYNEYFMGMTKPFIVRVLAWRALIRVSAVKQAKETHRWLSSTRGALRLALVWPSCLAGHRVSSEVRGEVGYRLPIVKYM